MDEASSHLRHTLVKTYRPYVERRLAEAGVDVAQHVDALGEAEEGLSEALDALLSTPYAEQRRGPLEIFQEAMAAPTAILYQCGIEPPVRDEVARAALPGDLYDLAPASSRILGDEVWAAHLSWGATKAAEMRSGRDD